jgi:hypothetical protein
MEILDSFRLGVLPSAHPVLKDVHIYPAPYSFIMLVLMSIIQIERGNCRMLQPHTSAR